MVKKEIKKVVCEQIMNMWDNNILREWNFETINGWLEDGDVFANADTHYTEEEIEEIMLFVYHIAPLIDELSWKLAPENDED